MISLLTKRGERMSLPLIYIVEDQPFYAKFLSSALKKTGYRVKVFNNPYAAIKEIEVGIDEISLIITDIMMPGMNGVEFVEWLSVHAPSIKTCVLSAKRSQKDIDRIFDAGADHYFVKGVELDILLDKVNYLVSSYKRETKAFLTLMSPIEAEASKKILIKDDHLIIYINEEYPIGGILQVKLPRNKNVSLHPFYKVDSCEREGNKNKIIVRPC